MTLLAIYLYCVNDKSTNHPHLDSSYVLYTDLHSVVYLVMQYYLLILHCIVITIEEKTQYRWLILILTMMFFIVNADFSLQHKLCILFMWYYVLATSILKN